MIMHRKSVKFAFALLTMGALSGCITLIDEPPAIITYGLQADAKPEAAWPSVNWSLTVVRPNSNSFLDSNRISVRPEPNVLQVYKGANWLDSLPDIVQINLVESFENSGKINTVSRQNSGVPADVALLLDIRQFEAVYVDGKNTPNVHIQIHAKVVEYPSNRVISSKTFSSETTPASKEVADVVQAFEKGLISVNQNIVAWTLSTGRAKNK